MENNLMKEEKEEMSKVEKMALGLSQAQNFLPPYLKNNKYALLAVLSYGDKLGMSAIESIKNIDIIQGKPSLNADATFDLVVKNPNFIAFKHEVSEKEATVKIKRKSLFDGEEQVFSYTFTMDDARRMNLLGKDNWKNFPKEMLLHRAKKGCARIAFLELSLPYDEEEIRYIHKEDRKTEEKRKAMQVVEVEKPVEEDFSEFENWGNNENH